MLSKSTIINWLFKCKTKALRSVETEINDKILSFYDIDTGIELDYNYLNTFKSQLDILEENYGSRFGFNDEPKYYSRTSGAYHHGKLALIMAYLDNHKYKNELEEIIVLCKKKDKVACEYNNLIDKVRSMRKSEKALQYIKDLGFDISTLSEDDTVDKKYLFVCGDNKPDITKKQE